RRGWHRKRRGGRRERRGGHRERRRRHRAGSGGARARGRCRRWPGGRRTCLVARRVRRDLRRQRRELLRALRAVVGDQRSMYVRRQAAKSWRPTAQAGRDPEEQQHRRRDHGPLRPAKGATHAASSSRMSDACGAGFLPISSRRAKIVAFLAMKAATTAGSNWRPDSLSIARAANSKEKLFRYGRSDVIASKASATVTMRASCEIA